MTKFDGRTAKVEHVDDRGIFSAILKAYERWLRDTSDGMAIFQQPGRGAYRVRFGSAPRRTFYVIGSGRGILFIAEEKRSNKFVAADEAAWDAVKRRAERLF